MLRLGTRGSKLALAQSTHVAQAITKETGVAVELVVISTRGDRILHKPLAEIGGKGLFTLELEEALRAGTIDFAVHSLKDLPTADPEGLGVCCIPKRADPRDVLIGPDPFVDAVIGTGSLRRSEQLRTLFPMVQIRGIRGNVDTRLAKRDSGEYDMVVLAAAGLERLGIQRSDHTFLSPDQMVPACGQGALALQAKKENTSLHDILKSIHDTSTADCVEIERYFLAALQGGCHIPAGCLAQTIDPILGSGSGFHVRAFLKRETSQTISFQAHSKEQAKQMLLHAFELEPPPE